MSAADSKHVGIEGKRIEMELTVQNRRPCQTSFGPAILTTMLDDFDNVVKTFTAIGDVQVGQRIRIKATIAHHDWYKGTASTMVNRVKVL